MGPRPDGARKPGTAASASSLDASGTARRAPTVDVLHRHGASPWWRWGGSPISPRSPSRQAGGKAETEVGQDDRNRNGPHDWGRRMTRYRRGFAWVVVGLLVFTLVATLVLEGIAW